MIVSFGYWDLYEAYLHHTDPKPHEKRRWGFCRAANFGDDMYLVTVNEDTEEIHELLAGHRFLGASAHKKDKKTGEEKAVEWHWLVKLEIR